MLPATLSPQDNDSGPQRAFPHLTEREEAFVYALLANGGKLKAAAIKAGYAKTSASVTASRISRKPEVIAAMRDAAAAQLGVLSMQAVKQIGKLGMNANSERVRLEAARDVLDRVGLKAPSQVRVGGSLSISIDLT